MPGDVQHTGDLGGAVVEDQTAAGTTISAETFVKSLVPALEVSGNAGAVATTLPTAEQILNALRGNWGVISPPNNSPYDAAHNNAPAMEWPANLGIFPPGVAFRWIVRNLNGGTNTITAGTGTAITGTATIATNKWREFVVKILSSAPSVVLGVATTNASKVLTTTDLITLRKIQVGQLFTGTGAGASAKVVSVNYDTGVINVDVNSTATAALIAGTFGPNIALFNLRAGDV